MKASVPVSQLGSKLKVLIRYLDSLDWNVGNTKHLQQYSGFLRAAALDIDPKLALKIIVERIEENGGQLVSHEIERQQQRAYEYLQHRCFSNGVALSVAKHRPKPRFSPAILKRVAAKAGVENVVELIASRSMYVPSEVSGALFLSQLYNPCEKVAIFTVFKGQGEVIYEVGHTPPQQLPKGGPDGVWFLTNPVDGKFHTREGHRLSRRSEESVTAWRYLVQESDKADISDWLGAIVQIPLPIVAIYTSGGRSIHCLVRLDAESKTDWDGKKNALKGVLITLGADPGALTAVRLSRLPQCWRGDRKQKLLFLNPGADGTAIMAQPERGRPNESTCIAGGI